MKTFLNLVWIYLVFTLSRCVAYENCTDPEPNESWEQMSCPVGRHAVGTDSCYWILEQKRTWLEARQACQNEYIFADLAVFGNERGESFNTILTRLNFTPSQTQDSWVRGTLAELLAQDEEFFGLAEENNEKNQCWKRSSPNGTFVTEDCDKNLGAICVWSSSSKIKPTVSLEVKWDSNKTRGQVISTCVFRKTGHELRAFQYMRFAAPNNGNKQLDATDNITNLNVDEKCQQYYMATTHLPISHFRHESFTCCVRYSSGHHTCASPVQIPESYHPGKPILELSHAKKYEDTVPVPLGEILRAICLAPIGYSDYNLSWVLKTKRATTVWIHTQAGELWTIPGEGSNLDPQVVSASVSRDPLRVSGKPESREAGQTLTSTLTLVVTNDLHDAELACFTTPNSRSYSKETMPDEITTWTETFSVVYLPQIPHLSIMYDVEPDGVYDDKVFVATCIAHVGSGSVLLWLMDDHMLGQRWRHSFSVTMMDEKTEEKNLPPVFVSSTVEHTAEGPKIHSQLRLDVPSNPKHFHGCIVSCLSEQTYPTEENLFLYDGYPFLRHSLPLRIISRHNNGVYAFPSREELAGNLTLATEYLEGTERRWEDNLTVQVIFLLMMSTLIAVFLHTWWYPPSMHRHRPVGGTELDPKSPTAALNTPR